MKIVIVVFFRFNVGIFYIYIFFQGALEKHIQKHADEDADFPVLDKQLKQEDNLNHIKLEPEVKLNEANGVDDNDFLDRLLDDLDYPIEERRRKKKKKKPPTKDFSCSDCGKAFYFQKNLFTHVVEVHGKSVDELPNLALVKSEDGIIRKVQIKNDKRLTYTLPSA